MSVLAGIHPVEEALQAGRPIDRILIARGAAGARLQQIIDRARSLAIPIRFEPRGALDRVSPTAAHQGVVALAAARRYAELEDVIQAARLIVLIDGVTDPHNLGAIVRSAHAAGASAVAIPERRAAPLNEAALKASAGAAEHIPIARVASLNRAIELLKQRGFWVYGLDERGAESYDEVEFHTPTALVLGSEGEGLHQQARKNCDVLIRIPVSGRIASLNVSVAAGIVFFEWKRRAR